MTLKQFEYPKDATEQNKKLERKPENTNPSDVLKEAEKRLNNNALSKLLSEVEDDSIPIETITSKSEIHKWMGNIEKVIPKDREIWEKQALLRQITFLQNSTRQSIGQYQKNISLHQNKEMDGDRKYRAEMLQIEQVRLRKLSEQEAKIRFELIELTKDSSIPDTTVLLNPDGSVPVFYRASHHLPDEKGEIDHVRLSGHEDTFGKKLGIFVGNKEEAIHHAKGRAVEDSIGFSLLYKLITNIKRPLFVSQKFWPYKSDMNVREKMKEYCDAVIVFKSSSNDEEGIHKVMQGDFSDVMDIVVYDSGNIVPISVSLFENKV